MQAYVCSPELSDALDYSSMKQISTEFVDIITHNYYYGDMLWEISDKASVLGGSRRYARAEQVQCHLSQRINFDF